MIATRIAYAALWLCAPAEDAEAIFGDLEEEYVGLRLSRRWLVSQAVRSAVPLLVTRWRRGELAGLIAAAMITILAPLRLADLLWAFIRSQVPMKTDLSWPSWMWTVNLILAIAGAAILGIGARSMRSAVSLAILGAACGPISLFMTGAVVPGWYVALLCSAIPSVIVLGVVFLGRTKHEMGD